MCLIYSYLSLYQDVLTLFLEKVRSIFRLMFILITQITHKYLVL